MLRNINIHFRYFLRLLKDYDVYNKDVKKKINRHLPLLNNNDYTNYVYSFLEGSNFRYIIDIIWLNKYIVPNNLTYLDLKDIEKYSINDIGGLLYYVNNVIYEQNNTIKILSNDKRAAITKICEDKEFAKKIISIIQQYNAEH